MPASPFIAPSEELRTYTGVCRCKANKFTIELPKLTSAMTCNCSICAVHSIYWIFTNKDKIKSERSGPTIDYKWNQKQYIFHFCATCGNLGLGSMAEGDGIAVNLRILQDVNIWEIKSEPHYDGASLPPSYKATDFAGPPFTSKTDGQTKIYHGGCHCGACTIAVQTAPLPEVEAINECNCAYCWKDARIHIYPSSDQVHIGGLENMKLFKTDENGGGGFFCKNCGVALFDADLDGAKDKDGKPIPNATKTLGHDLNIRAVNIRALRNVEWDALKVNRYDGRNNDPQFVAD